MPPWAIRVKWSLWRQLAGTRECAGTYRRPINKSGLYVECLCGGYPPVAKSTFRSRPTRACGRKCPTITPYINHPPLWAKKSADFSTVLFDLSGRTQYICFMYDTTAIYVRVSTANGTQTTDSQEHELTEYCQRRGWKEFTFYRDQKSGAATGRQGLEQMMADVRAGKVKRVCIFKLDRLGRSLSHLALLLDELQRHSVPLVVSTQGIDTSNENPAGRLQLAVLMAVAEFERGIIRERVNAGLAAARARGVCLGRPCTLNRRRGEVLNLREQGRGIRAIARELNMPVSSVGKLLKESK